MMCIILDHACVFGMYCTILICTVCSDLIATYASTIQFIQYNVWNQYMLKLL